MLTKYNSISASIMSALLPDIISADEATNNTETINKNATQTTSNNLENNIDAPELASLLQCIGFSLQSFERNINTENQQPSSLPAADDGFLQIDITCSKSHMKATLIKQKDICKCPSKEDATNAQFWNISACSPALSGNVTISKSSLIPTISVEKSKFIHTLLLKALNIVSYNAADKNTENFVDLFKNSVALARHKSLENLKSETTNQDYSKSASNNENWKRQPSSPHTSSPIPQSTSSTKQDSEKDSKLMEAIRAAHKLLSEALDLAANQNTTFTKRPRRISDLKISPLSVEDQHSRSNSFNVSKPDSSCCKTPKKPKTPKKVVGGIGDKKKLSLPPSKLGLLRPNRRSDSAILTDNVSASKKVSPFMKDKSLKLNLSGVKSKIGVKNDTPSRLRIPSKIATFTSTSARTPKKI